MTTIRDHWEPCSPQWLAAMPEGACAWAPRRPGDGRAVSHYHPARPGAELPPPVSRADVLREAANSLACLGPEDSLVSGPTAWTEAVETLRRMADEAQPGTEARTPCSVPNPCEDGELCTTHEKEQAHAEGEHAFCGDECEAAS